MSTILPLTSLTALNLPQPPAWITARPQPPQPVTNPFAHLGPDYHPGYVPGWGPTLPTGWIPGPTMMQPIMIRLPQPPKADTFVRQTPVTTLTAPDTEGTTAVSAPSTTAPATLPWQNQLKQMFHQNQSVIYALNLRTFGAVDRNGDGHITHRRHEDGGFLSAIPKLEGLAKMGINTIHLLPINPVGHLTQFGEAGSLYAPSDYGSLNPDFDTPGNGVSVVQEARMFVDAAHKVGIHVMVDVPSCASHDLAMKFPELIAADENGNPKVPANWLDILKFVDTSPALRDYFQKYFDLMVDQVGVDGFRVDVARVRPDAFWQHFIAKYPDKAWLAESYVHEDASPIKNMPFDRPESLLKSGFDAVYGQFHIFHFMRNGQEYLNYLRQVQDMLATSGENKSVIGSFLTHDDPSMMESGGVLQYMLCAGLMATQPFTNPYILDGFTTAYPDHYDIFNYVERPVGENPQVGQFLKAALQVRHASDGALTVGSFTPVTVHDGGLQQVFAFTRQQQGRTFLVVANKDVNARHSATLSLPGLSDDQTLNNLVPEYGAPSRFQVTANQVRVSLGPGRFHLFEITLPSLDGLGATNV
jgi:glycosidase